MGGAKDRRPLRPRTDRGWASILSGSACFDPGELGRDKKLTYPDGHRRVQGYDVRGNLATRCYEYDDAQLTRCYGAGYDAVGNPTSLTDPEGTDVVAVDNLDRLSSVTRQVSGQPDAVESYAHNAMGALSVNAGVAMDHQRPALSNGQLTDAAVPASWNGQPVVLDAGGRITSFGGATLAYNRRNQLVHVTDGTSEEYYDYDVWGRRIGVIHGDNSGDFYVHEGANVEAILHANPGTNAWTTDFQLLYDGIDHPLRVNASGTVAYYELDVIGNVRRLRGVGGTDLGGYRYTAFGKLVEATATIEQPLRWQGRLYTELAGGMYDVRAREWSPELAVFVSADEFQYLTTRGTLWSWPLGNPVRWRDPSGRIAFNLGGQADAAAGVGYGVGVGIELGWLVDLPGWSPSSWSVTPYVTTSYIVPRTGGVLGASWGIGGVLGIVFDPSKAPGPGWSAGLDTHLWWLAASLPLTDTGEVNGVCWNPNLGAGADLHVSRTNTHTP